MIIDAQRLIADHGPYGNNYNGMAPAFAPALHANEINDYYASFNLRDGETIQSTAWTVTPADGITSAAFVPDSIITVRDLYYRHARGIRLSTPTTGTTYTAECAVSTSEGRTLTIQFMLRGLP